MNELNEAIEKAQETAILLMSELMDAHRKACYIERPEGQTPSDVAMVEYLSGLMKLATKLERRLGKL